MGMASAIPDLVMTHGGQNDDEDG